MPSPSVEPRLRTWPTRPTVTSVSESTVQGYSPHGKNKQNLCMVIESKKNVW
jgi:hypothetical protein